MNPLIPIALMFVRLGLVAVAGWHLLDVPTMPAGRRRDAKIFLSAIALVGAVSTV